MKNAENVVNEYVSLTNKDIGKEEVLAYISSAITNGEISANDLHSLVLQEILLEDFMEFATKSLKQSHIKMADYQKQLMKHMTAVHFENKIGDDE